MSIISTNKQNKNRSISLEKKTKAERDIGLMSKNIREVNIRKTTKDLVGTRITGASLPLII